MTTTIGTELALSLTPATHNDNNNINLIKNVTLEAGRHILSIIETEISFTCRECAEGTLVLISQSHTKGVLLDFHIILLLVQSYLKWVLDKKKVNNTALYTLLCAARTRWIAARWFPLAFLHAIACSKNSRMREIKGISKKSIFIELVQCKRWQTSACPISINKNNYGVFLAKLGFTVHQTRITRSF